MSAFDPKRTSSRPAPHAGALLRSLPGRCSVWLNTGDTDELAPPLALTGNKSIGLRARAPDWLDAEFREFGFEAWLREDFVDSLVQTIKQFRRGLRRCHDRKPRPRFKTWHPGFYDRG